jgi:MoaA/NifB/PqqE/SkfB family radical SAM enzyme/tetratricopeptide (TPR) repeat protein/SAM-dependent methyltransferase
MVSSGWGTSASKEGVEMAGKGSKRTCLSKSGELDDEFKELEQLTKGIDGRISLDEAKLLYLLARDGIGSGAIVEIGSYQGYSTIWLAWGTKSKRREKVYAIDSNNTEEHGDNEAIFRKNIERANVSDYVEPIISTSNDASKEWQSPIRLLWVDGAHDYENVKNDFVNWTRYLIDGGIIAFHDYLSLLHPDVTKVVKKNILRANQFEILGCCETVLYAKKIRSFGPNVQTNNENLIRSLKPREKAERKFWNAKKFIQEGKYEKANSLLTDCEIAVKGLFSEDSSRTRLISIANAFMDIEDYAKAEEIYKEIMEYEAERKLVSENYWALWGLGNVALWRKDFQLADTYFKKALAIERIPNERKTRSVLGFGRSLSLQRRFEEAAQLYSASLTARGLTEKSRHKLLRGQGDALTELGNLENAQTSYKEALAIKKVPDLDKFFTLLGFGKCCLRNKKTIRAIEIFEEAMKTERVPVEKRVETILRLGEGYMKEGRHQKAKEIYSIALSLENLSNKSIYRILYRLGDIHIKNGKYYEAKQKFEEALSIDEIPEEERRKSISGIKACKSRQNKIRKSRSEDSNEFDKEKQYGKSSISKFRVINKTKPYEALQWKQGHRKIEFLKDLYKGERAFIIGNGRSLNSMNLQSLRNEITFGVNCIFYNFSRMGFKPNFYVVEDVLVAEDRREEIDRLSGMTKIFGEYLKYCLKDTDNVIWANVKYDFSNYPGFPHFSKDASQCMWVGGTVSYLCMQLAYYMGFEEVYLIGFDHDYVIPRDAKIAGRVITSSSNDPNHFHPEYFGKGKRWHDPQIGRMEKAYRKAKEVFEADGRRIYNATVGGYLEVFPRVKYNSLFGNGMQKQYFDFGSVSFEEGPKQLIQTRSGLIEEERNEETRRRRFSHLVLDYTRMCNGKCTYCSIWRTKCEHELSLGVIEEVFRSLNKFGLSTCYITGGEPYISDKIVDIARLLHQHIPGCRISGATNAVEPEKILGRIEKIRKMGISLETHVSLNGTENVHDSTRGLKGNWKNAMSLIEKLKSEELDVVASMSLMPQTIRDLPYMQELCRQMGVRLMFSWVRQSPRYDTVNRRYSNWSDDIKPRLREIEYLPSYFDCPGLSERLVVTPDGNLYPCEVYHPEILLGNVNEESVETILESSHVADIEMKIKTKGCRWCQGVGEIDGSPQWMLMDCYRRHSRQACVLAQEFAQAVFMPTDESRRVIEDIIGTKSNGSRRGKRNNPSKAKHEKPLISAIICTYRNPEYLRMCIESQLNQTLPRDLYEVIVVDNNPNTQTKDVVSSYRNVVYVVEENIGLSFARNRGISFARGAIVAFIDDDAEASPGWLASLLDIYNQFPDAMAAGGRLLPIWDAKRPEWLDESYYRALSLVHWGDQVRPLNWPERLIGVNFSFRRDVFDRFGLFDTNLGRVGTFLLGSEDVEIQRRIEKSGRRIYYNPDAIVYHHVPASRMTREYFKKRAEGHILSERIIDFRDKNKEEEINKISEQINHKVRKERKLFNMNALGEQMFSVGNVEKALNLFNNIIRIDSEYVMAHNNLGVLYWQLGEKSKSIEHLRKALNIDPSNRDVTVNCAEILKSNQDNKLARKVYQAYLQRFPDDEEIRLHLNEVSMSGSGFPCAGKSAATLAVDVDDFERDDNGQSCKICGGKAERRIAYSRTFYQCEECDFIFATDYDSEEVSRGMGMEGSWSGPGGGGYREYFLVKMLSLDLGFTRFLLYGTGNTPTFAKLLREGIDVVGCDISLDVVERKRATYGTDCFFAPYDLPTDKNYDAIVAVEVFEHFTDPKAAFSIMKNRLRKNGVICGTTNFYLGETIEDENNPGYMSHRSHVAYWSVRSMKRLAEYYGYAVAAFELICPGSVLPDEKYGQLWPNKRVFFIYDPIFHQSYFEKLFECNPILPIDRP